MARETNATMAAKLIEQSATEGSLRHVQGNRGLMIELCVLCDDYVETRDAEGLMLVEYWGKDDEGREWRVHVHPDGNSVL